MAADAEGGDRADVLCGRGGAEDDADQHSGQGHLHQEHKLVLAEGRPQRLKAVLDRVLAA
jgi:hypothetical protein